MRPLIFTLCIAPGIASAGGITDICLERDGYEQTVCQCIEDRLSSDLGEQDLALYIRVSTAYFANLDADMARSDAWDAAVRAEANSIGSGFIPLLERTNKMGQAHRAAMKECKP